MPAVPRLSAFEDYEDATTDRRKDCLGWPMRTMPNSSITPVAETFDGSVVREAIREAQPSLVAAWVLLVSQGRDRFGACDEPAMDAHGKQCNHQSQGGGRREQCWLHIHVVRKALQPS